MIGQMLLVLNPQAGKGRARRLFPLIEKKLRAHGLTFDTAETSGPGHASELVVAALRRGTRTVVAAGGDGTVREVVNSFARMRGHAQARSEPILGIIPIGSGNDFIKSVGVPRGLDEACATIAQGVTRPVDLVQLGTLKGRADSMWCANAVGIGFDALAVVEANRIRFLRGLPLYLLSVLQATRHYDCPRTVIELDGTRLEQPILLVACANGQFYGGGFHIAPEAKPDDGLLDVCVIDAVSRWRIIQKLLYVIKGTHAQLPEVKFYRAKRIKVTSPDILYVQADGDLLPELDPHCLEIEVLSHGLRVLVPGDASEKRTTDNRSVVASSLPRAPPSIASLRSQ
jgi:YegS/Rv2252/BmrU family lipid kinase